jgi:hypothetical protein
MKNHTSNPTFIKRHKQLQTQFVIVELFMWFVIVELFIWFVIVELFIWFVIVELFMLFVIVEIVIPHKQLYIY